MLTAKTVRTLLCTLSVALLAGGCGGSASPPAPAAPVDLSTVLTITVRNDQLDEATVWLWIDGRRQRLGSVRGTLNETFYHPMTRVSQVHMEFDLTLGEHCVTRDVSLGPGDNIEARIPTNLNMMAAVCRRR